MEKERSSQSLSNGENEQIQSNPEPNQGIPVEIAMWAGDLFEQTGSMGFRKNGNNVRPQILYSGEEETTRRLLEHFGGTYYQPTETVHRWMLAGNPVARFARSIAPFNLKRQDFLDAVKNWDQMSIPERNQSAATYQEIRLEKEQQKIAEMEKKAKEISRWFAGIFLVAGSPHMINGSPSMRLSRSNLHEAETLKDILKVFGPSIYHDETYNTYYVSLIGEPVAVIARAIKRFIPSRKAFIAAASSFDQPKSERGNIEVPAKRESVEQSVYEKLLTPEIMAGIVDARGSFYFRHYKLRNQPGYTKYPALEITFEDEKLLEAIHKQYSSTKPIKEQGATSYSITFNTTSLLHLYNIIKPHLILRADRAKNTMERLEPEQIKNSILSALAENLSTMSLPDLQARARQLIGFTRIELRDYILQLIKEERITESTSQKGALKFNVEHQENISIVQQFPPALEEFFQKALQKEILMSATGEIIATGENTDSFKWYRPKPYSRQQLSIASKSGNRFTQFSDQGRVLNYFRRVHTITDPREIRAIVASIEMAFQRAYEYILENYEDETNSHLPEESPREIAQRLFAKAWSK